MRANRHQSGVMLIEALIGILIFSIGILALLGMQGAAIKNTNDARYRSEAAFLAQQIVGQMWTDIPNLGSYDSDNPGPYPPRDLWVQSVGNLLPGITAGDPPLVPPPTIQVGPDAAFGLAAQEVRVQVQWRQPGETQTRQVTILNRIHLGSGA